MRYSLLLVILVIFVFPVSAQLIPLTDHPETKTPHFPTPNQFEHLSTDDGLPSHSVTAILQDRAGFVWFGTRGGLNKYDSHTFTIFRPNPVSSFLADGPDGLWFGTWDSLYYTNQTTGRYTHYPSETPAQFISLHQIPDGNLWLGGEGGFASLNQRTHLFTYYKYEPGAINGLPDKAVYGLVMGRLGEGC